MLPSYSSKMSVPERIAALKNIFAEFGIPVAPNSSLDQAIHAEFGRGKRSKLTQLLLELHSESDAGRLATCIGDELKINTKDQHILAVSTVLRERLPPLLDIIDVRQSTDKRERLLAQLLDHFANKIEHTEQTDRLLRMLTAAQKNLLSNIQVQAVGAVAEKAGMVCNMSELRQFGRILQGLTPALVAIEQLDYPIEQKINHCVHGLRVLAIELRSTKLHIGANVLEDIHWLAKVSLPLIVDHATVEQALQNLGISVGTISVRKIQLKALQSGLTSKEIVQILYASAPAAQLHVNDQELLLRTRQNQQYAAICGYLAKLAQDVKQPELAKLSIAGICLASMRQTFYEVKTSNIHPANFSESLGTVLTGIGAITQNRTLGHIGSSIIAGVQTYAGIMAIPGGAVVAVPLAVCSMLSNLFLTDDEKDTSNSTEQINDVLYSVLHQVVSVQQQMRYEFASLYAELHNIEHHILNTIEQGFANLASLMRYNNVQLLSGMRLLDHKLQHLQIQMQQEFADLYLEYIHDPLEEIDFANKYGGIDPNKMVDHKHKLAMWLLYKSKHPKVNGGNYALEDLTAVCARLQDQDQSGALSLINRYVNVRFRQQLPEDMPHIRSWLLAAQAYVMIAKKYPADMSELDEMQFLTDVQVEGRHTLNFIEQLAENNALWLWIRMAMLESAMFLQGRWSLLKLQINNAYLKSITNLYKSGTAQLGVLARSAATSQLEPFTPINVDISTIWDTHIRVHIPEECLLAVEHGLGTWHITFAVDKNVNSFTEVHIPYGAQALPNHARDVLFKVEVYFKNQQEQLSLLTTSWFAYDLGNAQQRFEQYYNRKFKYGLRHKRYHWVSLDGRSNQVEGHGTTLTHKLIDHDRLATIYQEWLIKAQPINTPEILDRVKQNSLFAQQYNNLLTQAECTIVQNDNIALLQILLRNELQALMLTQRLEFACILQQDTLLRSEFAKLDVYYAILAVYMPLLNMPFTMQYNMHKFSEIMHVLQQSEALNSDLLERLNALFLLTVPELHPGKQYLEGEVYTKMLAATARIGLLQTNVVVEKLRLMGPM